MPWNNDILNMLGTTPEYATPQQMADLREFGKANIQIGSEPRGHRLQAIGDILGALSGRMQLNQSYGIQSDAAKAVFGSNPYNTPPQRMASLEAPPSAPSAPTQNAAGGRVPASIRNNNPGAQWPGPSATKFGSTSHENLNDGKGNKIATFSNPVDGAAATFDLLATSGHYINKPVVEAMTTWKGGNARDAAALVQRLGMNPNQPLTKEFLASPQGITFVKALADSEAPQKFPLDDAGWAQAQAKALGTAPVSASAPPQAAAPGGIPPAAIAEQAALETGSVAPPASPAQMASTGGEVPIPSGPVTAPNNAAPVAPQLPVEQPAPQPNPVQTAQIEQPIQSMGQSFETKFPPPPPANWGMSPEQMYNLQFLEPNMAKMFVEGRQALYTPIMTEVEGGKRWVIPATKETGFIPEPKFGKMKLGDGTEVDTVTRIDPKTGKSKLELLLPGGGSAPIPGNAAPGQQGNAAPLNNLNDIIEFGRRQKAETEGRTKTAAVNAETIGKDIQETVEAGNSAGKTLQVVDVLKQIDQLPDTENVWTGPYADKYLEVDRFIHNLTGKSLFNKGENIAKAEVIQKFNVQLASALAKELTNRPTQWDLQTYINNTPGLLTTPEGRRTLTDLAGQISDYNKGLGELAGTFASADASQSKGWLDAKKQYKDNNKILFRYNGDPNIIIKSQEEANKLFDKNSKTAPTGQKPIRKWDPSKGAVQ